MLHVLYGRARAAALVIAFAASGCSGASHVLPSSALSAPALSSPTLPAAQRLPGFASANKLG
ncbi:MAG: hypothetical protein JO092_02605, partial [Candidatus Eremiobacteraeota bacterium]|nr:hypothetical protein [Candidatus Eremiobacteraeota bacterium]